MMVYRLKEDDDDNEMKMTMKMRQWSLKLARAPTSQIVGDVQLLYNTTIQYNNTNTHKTQQYNKLLAMFPAKNPAKGNNLQNFPQSQALAQSMKGEGTWMKGWTRRWTRRWMRWWMRRWTRRWTRWCMSRWTSRWTWRWTRR